MGINFVPKTKLGRWSAALIIAMLVFFFMGRLIMDLIFEYSHNNTQAQGIMFLQPFEMINDIFKITILAPSMIIGIICAVLAVITGLLAVIKQKEKALLVFASIAIGSLLILFLLFISFFANNSMGQEYDINNSCISQGGFLDIEEPEKGKCCAGLIIYSYPSSSQTITCQPFYYPVFDGAKNLLNFINWLYLLTLLVAAYLIYWLIKRNRRN